MWMASRFVLRTAVLHGFWLPPIGARVGASRRRVGRFAVAKIFINYRPDDDPSAAAHVRDALAASFGKSNVFMNVDNVLAGQRFNMELENALSQCDVLIAIIGLLTQKRTPPGRAGSGSRKEQQAGAVRLPSPA